VFVVVTLAACRRLQARSMPVFKVGGRRLPAACGARTPVPAGVRLLPWSS